MYLKIFEADDNHRGYQYRDGLNVDTHPFAVTGSCCKGGFYFTTPDYICRYLDYGHFIREVEVPEGAQMVRDTNGDKFRADRLFLHPRRSLADVSTWEWLIAVGGDIHELNDYALHLAKTYGRTEIVKLLERR